MGAQCSSDPADVDGEFSIESPINGKKGGPRGFGFCGTQESRLGRIDSSLVIGHDDSPCPDRPHSAKLAPSRRRSEQSDEGEADDFGESEEYAVRWAPPADDLPDKIDERQWQGMMYAMDQFLPFDDQDHVGDSIADNSTTTPSSSSLHARSDCPGKESFVDMAKREAAFEALRIGRPLCSIPKELRGDKDLVLAAIEQEGAYCYDYISDRELKERDRDVVLALVRTDGSLLENCSEELRADKQIVRCALATCSEALKVASAKLQCDKELKTVAATRAKEEQRLLRMFAEEMCGPNLTAACMPKR